MTAEKDKKKNTILTGVREIDEKLGGGIPLGSLGLIEGQPDSGKSVLSQHLAFGALTTGQMGVAYYTTENTTKSLIAQMDSLSLYTADFFLTDNFRIYPILMRNNTKAGRKIFSLMSLHLQNLPKRIKLIVFDSITQLVSHSKGIELIDFLWSCKQFCDEGRSVLLVAHHYAFEEDILQRSRSLCDTHLSLKMEDVGDKLVRTLEVLKVRGADRPTGDVVSFEIEPKSGMRIIPLAKARV